MNDKPFILILEGGIATGKSSVCRRIREEEKYVTLLDLNGIKDKSKEAENKMFKYHNQILDMFDYTKFCDMNYVCCRSFVSEFVYCLLGHKPYSFDKYYNVLIQNLDYLSKWYDIYYVLLTVKEEDLVDRLKRNKFEYVKHDIQEALKQQEQYKIATKKLANMKTDIKVFEIENKDLDKTVATIKDLILSGMIGE